MDAPLCLGKYVLVIVFMYRLMRVITLGEIKSCKFLKLLRERKKERKKEVKKERKRERDFLYILGNHLCNY